MLGLKTISDLVEHPNLRAGFNPEFVIRPDAWKGLVKTYKLKISNITEMQHSLAYEAIDKRKVDIVNAYSTDGKIPRYDLRLLER